jgi:hypothetical protein
MYIEMNIMYAHGFLEHKRSKMVNVVFYNAVKQ